MISVKQRSKAINICTAAEISSSSLVGLKKDDTNKDSNGKDKTASYSEDINTTHIKSRLQNLQSELSSVLQSLRSPPPDEVGTSKVTYVFISSCVIV